MLELMFADTMGFLTNNYRTIHKKVLLKGKLQSKF
jgi:hypothetical protein